MDAVLATVVLAVGLSFVTRGLNSQLRAIGSLDARETLERLSHQLLHDLERDVLVGRVPRPEASGTFEPPDETHAWSAAATPHEDPAAPVALSAVVLTVRPAEGPGPSSTVTTLWPTDLVPSEWH